MTIDLNRKDVKSFSYNVDVYKRNLLRPLVAMVSNGSSSLYFLEGHLVTISIILILF